MIDSLNLGSVWTQTSQCNQEQEICSCGHLYKSSFFSIKNRPALKELEWTFIRADISILPKAYSCSIEKLKEASAQVMVNKDRKGES